MQKAKTYEEKIRIILENRLEANCNYNVEIHNVIIWLCCEWQCDQIKDMAEYCRLKNEVDIIADEIMRRI